MMFNFLKLSLMKGRIRPHLDPFWVRNSLGLCSRASHSGYQMYKIREATQKDVPIILKFITVSQKCRCFAVHEPGGRTRQCMKSNLCPVLQLVRKVRCKILVFSMEETPLIQSNQFSTDKLCTYCTWKLPATPVIWADQPVDTVEF